jgi:PBP1b-binding outer membrane lipoprotein LpoB
MMKLINIAIIALVLFLASCATAVKFPVSELVPAADIVAKKKQDKNGNYKISIVAKNLAAAERLTPPRSNYIVWIVTESSGVIGVGRLINKNAKTASIEALTPYNFKEVVITAEDHDGVTIPSGTEITRVRFKK